MVTRIYGNKDAILHHRWVNNQHFDCIPIIDKLFSPINEITDKFQLLRKLQRVLLWLHKLLLASTHLGSYHQKTPEMESSKDLNCFTKRKAPLDQQALILLTMETPLLKLSVGFLYTRNMNFKCWPSLLPAMDRRVLLKLCEPMKTVS